jgi:hypothetical protein
MDGQAAAQTEQKVVQSGDVLKRDSNGSRDSSAARGNQQSRRGGNGGASAQVAQGNGATAMRGQSRGTGNGGRGGRGGGGGYAAGDVPAAPVRARTALVFVQTAPGAFEPRVVRLGPSNYDYSEVLGGLKEGETVALLAVASLQQRRDQQNDRFRSMQGGPVPGMTNPTPPRGGGGGGGGRGPGGN